MRMVRSFLFNEAVEGGMMATAVVASCISSASVEAAGAAATVFAIDLWDIARMAVETAGRTVAPTNSMSEATPVSRAIVFSCLVRSCMSAFRLHRWRNSTSGSQGAGRPAVELYRRFVLYRARNAVNHRKRAIAIIGLEGDGDCSAA